MIWIVRVMVMLLDFRRSILRLTAFMPGGAARVERAWLIERAVCFGPLIMQFVVIQALIVMPNLEDQLPWLRGAAFVLFLLTLLVSLGLRYVGSVRPILDDLVDARIRANGLLSCFPGAPAQHLCNVHRLSHAKLVGQPCRRGLARAGEEAHPS
jgi:hypothetical protein